MDTNGTKLLTSIILEDAGEVDQDHYVLCGNFLCYSIKDSKSVSVLDLRGLQDSEGLPHGTRVELPLQQIDLSFLKKSF